MSIVSFNFLIFLIFSLILFYVFPKKYRWIILLITSIIFFLLASSWYLILYFLFGVFVTYIGAIIIGEKCKTDKSKKIILVITLLLIILELFIFKYVNIFTISINGFAKLFNINFSVNTFNILAPLGISYYTLSLISYVVDVYWTTCKPQKNFFKHLLFACYYPVMISGPVVRYPEMKKELFNERKINWGNIYQGFVRIIFGMMKKMVIADALSIIVLHIFSHYNYYSGFYIIFGLICYAIQIYCDFSGCMDIVIGASKMYGVVLPENFKAPFLSKTLSEFWRRWHITLGSWSKDYIMYPLLKTQAFQKLGKKCKKLFGKNIGKKIPTIIAIFILWLLIGIWHGASFRYIFAAGVLPWIYLTVGELFEWIPEKLNKVLKIDTNTFSFRLFQSLRTFFLMCFVWLFVCAPSFFSSADLIKNIFLIVDITLIPTLPKLHWFVIVMMLLLVLVVDYLKYKDINVLEKFSKQNIMFRWFMLFLLIIIILIYGCYGPKYNAVDFIYGGF